MHTWELSRRRFLAAVGATMTWPLTTDGLVMPVG
jgi:hypothetical protein